MRKFTVLDLLDLNLKGHNALKLKCIGGRPGLVREITEPDINRPGLAISGFFENFAHKRIQVFGRGENAYLKKLAEQKNTKNIEELLRFSVPCCIFTHNLKPTQDFLKKAEETKCAILITELSSSDFSIRLIRTLSNLFAPTKTVHGVLVEVFGIGILIQGDSGVGKSEAALELIERGHRLVSDDMVEIRCVSGNILMGSGANKIIGHHMEIRGLGIINITHLFGVGAIRDKKQIQLVIQLEIWDSNKEYDRIGAKEQYIEILEVKVPTLIIPIRPGRNISIIIETAAMNERLKMMGYYSAREFTQNIVKWLESETAKATYFKDNKDKLESK